ncbi:hypothetical protein [Kineococcus esterisolvens]|uniref:hypothetical protein n=1 Tax=Kineococcus sp. SYSU DK017 TaxID=3383138 RepID=UPI003D7D57A8
MPVIASLPAGPMTATLSRFDSGSAPEFFSRTLAAAPVSRARRWCSSVVTTSGIAVGSGLS